ncbi:PHP domain-containing protein [Natranaerobius thermophilus]|uniref:PHP domain protein n=1 Tax=Natranaerobius thermophilus (strain ATCC BAA-1301 / DSM 18059 / JW/NM-WN-LF) TaxID=457570 RepID=B2A701_NATTJ|nr:PHP domain-containing protein [Natranaerobius thermophilus]ACB85592.1 PHP domain protein [Natranaerobius thermophilus JW/NM-WN-LF]
MVNILSDYHIHTKYSHGKGTIKENVLAAREKGLKELGINDHGPASLGFGIDGENDLYYMKREINGLNKVFNDISIYLGLEANVIAEDGTLDINDKMLSYLDYLSVGLHLMIRPKTIKDFNGIIVRNWFNKLSRLGGISDNWSFLHNYRKDIRKKNTDMLCRALDNYPIFMITHPGIHLDIDTDILAKYCGEKGVYLEINCAHLDKIKSYVWEASKASPHVKFILNSDAHVPNRVGELTAGANLCQELGLGKERVVNISSEQDKNLVMKNYVSRKE